MLWYFVARSMVTSADAMGGMKQMARPAVTPKRDAFFMELPLAIESSKNELRQSLVI
jgi:hypothetical protein